jgi:hypothetical protein
MEWAPSTRTVARLGCYNGKRQNMTYAVDAYKMFDDARSGAPNYWRYKYSKPKQINCASTGTFSGAKFPLG